MFMRPFMTTVVPACIFFAFANCRVLRFSANVLKGLCLVMFPATATLAEDALPDGSQAATAAMVRSLGIVDSSPYAVGPGPTPSPP